jgi:cystathionine gamma-synthase
VATVLTRYGVEQSLIPAGDLDALAAAIRPNTKLVLSESPTNPYLYCCDLKKLVEVVKSKGRIRTLVDSTFATPVNCTPIEFGVDLVFHSATKYLSGHNDVLGGLAAGTSQLVSLLREARGVLGSVLDPHAAFLIGRGLKTLDLRVARQNQTAQVLAEKLEHHPKVERVFYPGLESHPSHAVAKNQMNGYGGVISFIVKGGREATSRVVDGCKLAKIAPSLGGVETLIEQPAIMSYFELDEKQLEAVGISSSLIRLSVGIEDQKDVIEDVLGSLDGA